MIFEIKILNDFINYTNSLPFSKKVILDSKIFFLETTGFLENCKALGKGFFEFKINRIEELQLYCIIGNNIDIDVSKLLKSLKDVIERLKIFLKLKLIKYIAEKSGIPKNKLLSILKIRVDIEINDLINAIRYCKNPRSGK